MFKLLYTLTHWLFLPGTVVLLFNWFVYIDVVYNAKRLSHTNKDYLLTNYTYPYTPAIFRFRSHIYHWCSQWNFLHIQIKSFYKKTQTRNNCRKQIISWFLSLYISFFTKKIEKILKRIFQQIIATKLFKKPVSPRAKLWQCLKTIVTQKNLICHS